MQASSSPQGTILDTLRLSLLLPVTDVLEGYSCGRRRVDGVFNILSLTADG